MAAADLTDHDRALFQHLLNRSVEMLLRQAGTIHRKGRLKVRSRVGRTGLYAKRCHCAGLVDFSHRCKAVHIKDRGDSLFQQLLVV